MGYTTSLALINNYVLLRDSVRVALVIQGGGIQP